MCLEQVSVDLWVVGSLHVRLLAVGFRFVGASSEVACWRGHHPKKARVPVTHTTGSKQVKFDVPISSARNLPNGPNPVGVGSPGIVLIDPPAAKLKAQSLKVFSESKLEQIPQLQSLSSEQRFAMRVVSSVLPQRLEPLAP